MDENRYQSDEKSDSFDVWLSERVPCEREDHLLNGGEVLAEYRVVAFLGRGGCGEVYSARHEKLGSMAAIKILFKDTPGMRMRFEREAKILAEKRYRELPRRRTSMPLACWLMPVSRTTLLANGAGLYAAPQARLPRSDIALPTNSSVP